MVTWAGFADIHPERAEAGRGLLYQFGVGLGFLSTVRPDGGPRVHPMCPVLAGHGLYAFVVPSPKQDDLHRDGRFALHSFPCEDNEDAFYCAGRAVAVDDTALREQLADQFVAERAAVGVPGPSADHHLFEFDLHSVLLTRTTGHGDMHPDHWVWTAPDAPQARPAERRVAGELFNRTWDLIETPDRTSDDDLEMLLAATASRWHWGQVGGTESIATGDWQVGHVASLLGLGDLARIFAERNLATAAAEGWTGWRLASAHEGMARALATLGDTAGRARHVAAAEEALAGEPDEEERQIIADQLATVPGGG